MKDNNKPTVIFSSCHFPVTMARMFWDALSRRDDINLFSTGPFFNDEIPWAGGLRLPKQYVKVPDLPLPRNWLQSPPPYQMIASQLPQNADLFIQVDAGFHFATKPKAKVVALIESDPHVLQNHYAPAEAYSDIVFCMQQIYSKPGQIYLPYAVDDCWFYPEKREMIHDACLIGLHYPQRDKLVDMIRKAGKNVYYDIGVVYNEYRQKYNESRVALSWSSLQDLPVRVWEALGMKRSLVCNHVPDMDNFFIDGQHYLGFDNANQARDAVIYLLENPDEADRIASNGYKVIVNGQHNFDARIQFVLEKCGVI